MHQACDAVQLPNHAGRQHKGALDQRRLRRQARPALLHLAALNLEHGAAAAGEGVHLPGDAHQTDILGQEVRARGGDGRLGVRHGGHARRPGRAEGRGVGPGFAGAVGLGERDCPEAIDVAKPQVADAGLPHNSVLRHHLQAHIPHLELRAAWAPSGLRPRAPAWHCNLLRPHLLHGTGPPQLLQAAADDTGAGQPDLHDAPFQVDEVGAVGNHNGSLYEHPRPYAHGPRRREGWRHRLRGCLECRLRWGLLPWKRRLRR
mmetsp:Transcript_2214/g.8662  ORF Transcript_2214/g.8662 Transcript_2214/m.8662 type:complete len:260 (-) Transcript_2214:435-1214(-)